MNFIQQAPDNNFRWGAKSLIIRAVIAPLTANLMCDCLDIKF